MTAATWIDIEQQRPPEGERVIVLLPFGMRVEDDTWTADGFLNIQEAVSHWMPLVPPGTYAEIMSRPPGDPLPSPRRNNSVDGLEWLPSAVAEHVRMMDSIGRQQFMLRADMARAEAKAEKA